jgi:hypothetical protein
VQVVYEDHVSVVPYDAAVDGNQLELRAAELDRLRLLRGRFSPDSPKEREAWSALDADYRRVERGDLRIGWIEVRGSDEADSAETGRLQCVPDLTPRSVTDWPADELYVPLGGTSTIYETGSLQKFWLDGMGDAAVSNADDGLEIRTGFDTRGAVDCAMGQGASNLPDFYVRDWSLDFGYADYCAVGTVNAQALRPGVLYWVWTPFRSFLTSANPQFTVEYRPLERCSWVKTPEICDWLGGTYCLCRRDDLPPQPLVTYSYYDAPGQEVPWWRD